MVVFPNCKINIGLQVLSRREDGYHNLSSLFYPIHLHDALEVIENNSLGKGTIELELFGRPLGTPPQQNLIVQAYELLLRDFPQLPGVRVSLFKKIPLGAGLGGGSSDGSAMLQLLNDRFGLGLTKGQLADYALRLGSDCPFFIYNKPAVVEGRGEIINSVGVNLDTYKMVLVNPGITVSTKWAFSKVVPTADRPSIRDLIHQPISEWKSSVFNDFEVPIFKEYPEIAAIKESLYGAGALFSSMSGTGSTVFGLFDTTPVLRFPETYLFRII